MTDQEVGQLRQRLDKGMIFFRQLTPSEWKPMHKVWLTRYLGLLKEYLEWRDGEINFLRAKNMLENSAKDRQK